MSARKSTTQLDLANFGELRLIERIRARLCPPSGRLPAEFSVVEGIGDDTAVIRWGTDANLLLLTCDTLVEKIHFRRGTPPYRIGWKAMACNLSDIAAMGGIPQYAVISVACPAGTKVAEIDQMYAGMNEVGQRFGVVIVGGDTVESPHALTVTVTLVGKVEENLYVTRRGARPGDALCVTGTLGGSLLGKHLDFLPRVEEGRFLAEKFSPTAMIDISDGLATDLMKMMQASRTTAELYAETVPVSEAAERSALRSRVSPLDMALYDGEDFELLFTLPKEKVDGCLADFRKNFSTPIAVIGRVKRGQKKPVLIKKDGTTVFLHAEGYEHFRKSSSSTTAHKGSAR